MEWTELESAMEAILFAAGEPVGVERLCLALDIDRVTADETAQRLMDDYKFHRRGIRLLRMNASYQFCSAPEHATSVRKALESRKASKLSPSALEVLTVVAYYQPTTRAYIDQVRGVDSAYTTGLLLDRGLIEECGRLAVPGRPILYRTTTAFLRSFGLERLEDLPELPDSSPEGEQLTIQMQTDLAQLQQREEPS